MIWEHFPDLLWLFWYCTEQEVETREIWQVKNMPATLWSCQRCISPDTSPGLCCLLLFLPLKGCAQGSSPWGVSSTDPLQEEVVWEDTMVWETTRLNTSEPRHHSMRSQDSHDICIWLARSMEEMWKRQLLAYCSVPVANVPDACPLSYNWPLMLKGERFYEKKGKIIVLISQGFHYS